MQDLTDEEVNNLIYNNQTQLNTMLDAVVTAVNGDNTVDLRTNLKGQSITLHSVPLYQFNTIHVSIEYAISVGTQGVVLFFQRDVARKTGRMHSLQDGFFIPAFSKTSTVATGIKIQLTETEAKIEKDSKSILIDDNGIKIDNDSKTTIELTETEAKINNEARSIVLSDSSIKIDNDSKTTIELTETEAKVEINSNKITLDENQIKLDTGSVTLELSDKIVIKGDLEVQGKITATDNIESSADVKAGSVSLKDHKHLVTATLVAGPNPVTPTPFSTDKPT